MRQKFSAATALVALMIMGGCRTAESGGGVLPSPVRIVPHEGQPASGPGLCRRSGPNFLVRLHNPNAMLMAPVRVTVNFASDPAASREAQSSAIGPNSRVDVALPIPGGCFRPDCSFAILARDPSGAVVQAAGTCIG